MLVFIHELGHFLAAKSVGVRVEKFYIGFNLFGLGWKKVYKGTEYGIGLFPIGGYVKVAGVIDESFDTGYTGAPDEFRSKKTWQKVWIMSAGVIMNFVLAVVILAHLSYHNGISEADSQAVVGAVAPEYPAEKLGLLEGDEIISINGNSITDWDSMTGEIHSRPNESVYISWNRDGQVFADSVQTTSTPQLIGDELVELGMIGIMPVFTNREIGFIESFQFGAQRTLQLLDLTYRSLKALIKGNVSIRDIAGPITIVKIAGETASAGMDALLGLMAFLSVNLALINILPIPGLDGGHVVIALVEGLIRRELPLNIKLRIQKVGIFLLMILFFTIMVNDIQRLFN